MRRGIFVTFIFCMLASLLFSQEKLQKVSIQLNWKNQFEFAGFYIAKEKGFYKEAGLEVDIKELDKNTNILKDVLSNKSTFGIGYPTLILNKSKGKDIVLLAAILQSSPHVLVSLKSSGIKSVSDFKNKRIMISDDAAESASFLSMFLANNVKFSDMIKVKNSFNIYDLINKKVDIFSCYVSDEIYTLKSLGLDYNIWDPKDYGFDFYDELIFTSGKKLKEHPKLVKNFRDASIKGWVYAFSHISEAIDIIQKKGYNTQHKSRNALFYEALTLRKLAYYGIKNFGEIKKNKIQRIYDIYNFMGLAKKKIDLDKFILSNYQNKGAFNSKDIAYIKKKKTINVCTNPNWEPIEFRENTEPRGISIDTLGIVADRLHLGINYIDTKSWSQSQEFLKRKICDILPSAISTAKRREYANFTRPYLSYDLAIITKDDQPLVENLKSIIDKTMSRKKGSGLIAKLKNIYPNIKIKETKGYKEAFEAVSNGDVYFTIATLPVLSYYKNRYKFKNLQIAGYTKMRYNLSMAVRKDDVALLNILDKALDTISDKTKNIIYERWTKKEFIKSTDYSLVFKILAIVFILILVFIYRNKSLSKYNKNLSKQIEDRIEAEEKLKELNRTLDLKIKLATRKLKIQNQELQESVENFQQILDVTMEMIILLDEDRNIVDINQSGVKMFGFDNKTELIGTCVLKFVDEDELEKVYFESQKEIATPYELKLIKKDGSPIYTLLSARNIIRGGKKIRIATVMDLSELKQKDQQLLQQSRLAQMGEMISMIAHQWRQPLTAISATSGAINLKAQLNRLDKDMAIELSSKISNYSQHLSSTIDDFRDFFKSNKEKKETSYNEIVQNVLGIIETSIINKNIEIIKELNVNDTFNSYPNELKQVVMNLIKNAEDILLEKKIENPTIHIKTYKKDSKLILEVSDNAGGVPKDILPKIFDPYFSTKTKKDGTGLGLYMSKTIIEEHCGGTLSVSNSGVGAVFRVEISSLER